MNKLFVLSFLVIVMSLSTLIGVEHFDEDNKGLAKNNNELVSLVMEQGFFGDELVDAQNISMASLVNAALNNSNSQAMKQLLTLAENTGLDCLNIQKRGLSNYLQM